jgi:hypothetical protein
MVKFNDKSLKIKEKSLIFLCGIIIIIRALISTRITDFDVETSLAEMVVFAGIGKPVLHRYLLQQHTH